MPVPGADVYKKSVQAEITTHAFSTFFTSSSSVLSSFALLRFVLRMLSSSSSESLSGSADTCEHSCTVVCVAVTGRYVKK